MNRTFVHKTKTLEKSPYNDMTGACADNDDAFSSVRTFPSSFNLYYFNLLTSSI